MDTATVEQKLAALRTGEAVVRTRLSDLDAKLGAWVDAMTRAHGALQASLEDAAAAGHEISEPAAAASEPERPVVASPEGEDSGGEAPPAAESRPVPDAVADVPEAGEMAEQPAGRAAHAEGAAPGPPPPPPDARPRDVPAVPPPADSPGEPDGDEKLLASLEPEVANQIRVKRRLSGNRRSVRELLTEVEREFRAAKSDASGASRGSKRWWRKGND